MNEFRGRWRVAVLAGALAAILPAAGATTAAAAPKKIVFSDYAGGGEFSFDLFSVRPDGTRRRHITRGAGEDTSPSWSPNRRSLVFSRGGDAPSRLLTVRAGGSRLRRIKNTTFGTSPDWAPRGNRIAFVVERADGPDLKSAIFTIRPDGKRRKRLTAWAPGIGDPDWSRSGKSIAYHRARGIVRMRANGRRKRVVTRSGFSPSWAPNGRRIAFVDRPANPDAATDVYTVKINGTGRRNVTGNRTAVLCADFEQCRRQDDNPDWSPNGKRIVFSEATASGFEGIFTARLNGNDAFRVTRGGTAPDW